jgi:hypothetical protein
VGILRRAAGESSWIIAIIHVMWWKLLACSIIAARTVTVTIDRVSAPAPTLPTVMGWLTLAPAKRSCAAGAPYRPPAVAVARARRPSRPTAPPCLDTFLVDYNLTISGREKQQRGAFVELSWGGTAPVVVRQQKRTFLADGDEVVISTSAPGPDGTHIGFGEVTGWILPPTEGER